MLKSIAVGIREGELRAPYYESVPPEDIERVNERISSQNSLCFETAKQAKPIISELSKIAGLELEIFGAFEQMCVAAAVMAAIDYRFQIRVPKDSTIRHQFPGFESLVEQVKEYIREHELSYQLIETPDYYFLHPKLRHSI